MAWPLLQPWSRGEQGRREGLSWRATAPDSEVELSRPLLGTVYNGRQKYRRCLWDDPNTTIQCDCSRRSTGGHVLKYSPEIAKKCTKPVRDQLI
ncbi:hypothetical protein RRG08_067429 [Elysia crispata]|uniref:Uncharacterized protein n=1 Tax=Elysia crispata TaxID=231223 RepID=A0AAE1DF86_9GAST|nr:hypothetical protein RRG08_067429 [Elysia crispata]